MGYLTDGLTFNTLRDANVHRLPLFKNSRGEVAHSKRDGSDWSLGEWMCALTGEVGEAANIIKKIRRGDTQLDNLEDGTQEMLASELADVAIYLDLLAYQCGINLGNAIIRKWNYVSDRVGAPIRIDADDWHYTKDMTDVLTPPKK